MEKLSKKAAEEKESGVSINKGDTFLCQEEIAQGKELLFKNGGFYRSKADHSLVSENGSNYFGFNEDVLESHFVKV